MTLDFINKRIKEQHDYLFKLTCRWIQSEFDDAMYFELHESAYAQLEHFEQKKE